MTGQLNPKLQAALSALDAEWKAFQSAHGTKHSAGGKRKDILASVRKHEADEDVQIAKHEPRFWSREDHCEDSRRQNDRDSLRP